MSTDPSLLRRTVQRLRRRARSRRAEIFRRSFALDRQTRILDLGSQDGTFIQAVIEGTGVDPRNVYIADIEERAVRHGARKYGFTPVVVQEAGPLPFPDRYFEIVHCSSVIEHVTGPKDDLWALRSGAEFQARAAGRQQEMAREIGRLGRQYFVQTPCKSFPIESHSWLPFVGWFPRPMLLPTLRLTNRLWIKRTRPDWRLLGKKELAALFPDARILSERAFGLTKSIMAVRSLRTGCSAETAFRSSS